MTRQRHVAGFTLVELVMVIVIMGILAASIAVFFKPAVEGYFAARRRAELTDMADTALRRMGREVQRSVPYSVRQANDQCFEFVPSTSGGKYRQAVGALGDGSAPRNDWTATTFDVLSNLPAAPAVGDFVVIGNQGAIPTDVYAASSDVRSTVTKWESPPPGAGGATVGTGRVTMAAAIKSDSPSQHFFIVPQSEPIVSYVCRGAGELNGTGTGTLVRVSRNFTPVVGSCPSAGGTVVASKVAACTFAPIPDAGFVWMRVELLDGAERVALSYGVHVSNVP